MNPRSVLRPSVSLAVLVVAILAAGCAPSDTPPGGIPAAGQPVLQNRADSVATRIVEASGGLAAWASAPYLRFDYASGSDTARVLRNRHLWSKHTGQYRIEWLRGADTTYVALFDVDTREGSVYVNGQPVDSTQEARLLQQAYRRFINDTYWLMAPLKVFDPGVHRAYVPDSSTADLDVITLTFEQVGLTPGDQYWLYADKNTGRMVRWDFRLQHFEPTTPTSTSMWEDYGAYDAPAGTVYLAARKRHGNSNTFTDQIALPAEVPADLFTDPNPRLGEF